VHAKPNRFSDIGQLKASADAQAESIARELLAGRPCIRSGDQLRFGNNQSVSVEIAGPKAGRWFDHEARNGGRIIDLIMRERGCLFAEAANWVRGRYNVGSLPTAPVERPQPVADDGRREERALALWREARDPAGTPVETYLKSRGLALPEPGALRFHAAGPWGKERRPMMVALLRDIETNEPCGVARRILDPRPGERPKRTLGRAQGAAVKLDPDEAVETRLHLAEGIETALAARSRGRWPMWATGGTSGLLSFPVLAGLDGLHICADHDHDGTGVRAAEVARARYAEAGVSCRVLRPRASGSDYADLEGTHGRPVG
jgi:hypothetical protein